MRRYTTVFGAQTTAGGKVITASSTISIGGVKVALEGDKLFCPACNREGTIKCDGPRLSETYCGKNVSFDGDLCVCGCPTPPKLIAAQTIRSQVLEGEEAEAWARDFEAMKAVHGGGDAASRHHGKVAFVSEQCSKPMVGTTYASSREGSIAAGVADANGRGEL